MSSALSAIKKSKGGESVKVIVRCRPFIERERRIGEHKRPAVVIEAHSRQVSLMKSS